MTDRRELRILSRAESLDLLAASRVGRVILSAHALPTAMPVNYVLDGERVVFRSGQGIKLSAADAGTVVAFEVDHFDTELRVGWSVLLTGVAHRLTQPSDVARAERLEVPTWVEPDNDFGYVSIDVGSVTGRRLLPVPHGVVTATSSRR